MLFYDSATEKLQAAEGLVKTINIVCLIMPANHISLFNVIFNDSPAGRIEARETKEDCQHEYLLLFFFIITCYGSIFPGIGSLSVRFICCLP